MASHLKIRVMISSRCKDKILFNDEQKELSDVRYKLKQVLENIHLFNNQLFEVWINEDAPPDEGSLTSWEHCMKQVRDADIVLVLYNGNSGWTKEDGDIGICHAELQTALSTAPAKVRLIKLEPLQDQKTDAGKARDERFRNYVESQSLFRGSAKNGEEIIKICKQSLRDAVVKMVHRGVQEASKGEYHTGEALDWSRLDFLSRKNAMESSIQSNLKLRKGSKKVEKEICVRINNKLVLVLCHAIPSSITVPAAREMIGQPFLHDYKYSGLLEGGFVGPVHLIACHSNITEAQARKLLGFPDAIIVSTPFGIYLADNIQKIQLVLIANCRNDTSTRIGVQRIFDWLEQSGEDILLSERAKYRTQIVKTIAMVASK